MNQGVLLLLWGKAKMRCRSQGEAVVAFKVSPCPLVLACLTSMHHLGFCFRYVLVKYRISAANYAVLHMMWYKQSFKEMWISSNNS